MSMSTASQAGLTVLIVMTILGCGCAIELGIKELKARYKAKKEAKNQ